MTYFLPNWPCRYGIRVAFRSEWTPKLLAPCWLGVGVRAGSHGVPIVKFQL